MSEARPQPRRVTVGRVLRGILANPVPPTEPLQWAISPPQGLHPGLAVAFTAEKPAEFGHCPVRIAERQGLPGRIGFWVVARRSKTAISVGEDATVGD